MLKEIEKKLVVRYKYYLKQYDKYERTPNSCEGGHLQEISWLLHELFGYTDEDVDRIEMQEDIINNFIQ